jgi:Mn2+/Fe2+ NRAMP family transporter
VQLLNGILLPVILIFLMLLINDRRIAGNLTNGRAYNVLGWGTVALIAIAIVAGAGAQVLSWFGIGAIGS